MTEPTDTESSSNALARRALFITAILALAGSCLGVVAIVKGAITGIEIIPEISGLAIELAVLGTLLLFRTASLQIIAGVSTAYYGIHLCASLIIAVAGTGLHTNLFVYLFWFFPLLVFNKLVNAPAMGKWFESILLLAPLLILTFLSPRLNAIFHQDLLFMVAAWSLSYLCFGLMFGVVTRYREEYIIERERAESLKLESEVLESISDCFISLDSASRLVYLNDAACLEFQVERNVALKDTIRNAAPGFFSPPTLAGLESASSKVSVSMFEGQSEKRKRWYEIRCFPKADGMSVCFRNITESILSRSKLAEANRSLREQAELLDKAQDAIFVQDMDHRVVYWNRGAERLYGWTAEEVIGRLTGSIFQAQGSPDAAPKIGGTHPSSRDSAAMTCACSSEETPGEMNRSLASALLHGEWCGEVSHRHRDGGTLTVESRCTLVRAEDGTPRSILAINTDITSRKAAEARIHHLAFYDVLTGLPNRLLLRERLEAALATAVRTGKTGALIFIDIDDFKTLNDTLGHDTGDMFLRQVARRLIACVQAQGPPDAAPDNGGTHPSSRDPAAMTGAWSLKAGATVARLGGDEFVVMLEELSDESEKAAAESREAGDKIMEAFVEPFPVGDFGYESTASIGVALFPARQDSVDDLLKRADLAMYQAKARGRNSLCFFEPAMQTLVTARAALRTDLRRALQNREFHLHYQPQVNGDGRVIGAEALVRWQHPRSGLVYPGEFIPLAEEAGLIVELGRLVLETACAQLAKWAANGEMGKLVISVNVSIRQFINSNFVNLVEEVLLQSGANPRRLKLEITESSVIEKIDDTIARMSALKRLGVGFSLDDFGTGYSSLSHLRRLPLDQLKIDRSFVSDVLTDSRDASVVRTIITLGKNLNLQVIAEGVETEGQRAFLEREGCHAYQGYLFSAALTSSELENYVAATLPEEGASRRASA